MVLVGQGMQEEEELFYCFIEELNFLQVFLLSLQSFFICCHMFVHFFQHVTSSWFKESLEKCDQEPPIPQKRKLVLLPQTTKLVLLYTPKHLHSHEQKLEYPDLLFLPLMDAFMVV
jgi:hypothetical protein